jgi:hypothetical protein
MSRSSEDTSTKGAPRSIGRRAFELAGVVPLLAFVVLHMLDALRGDVGGRPPGIALEIALVWLPLAFHVGYALRDAMRSNAPRPKRARRQMLESASAWLSLGFVLLHTWHIRVPLLRGILSREGAQLELIRALSSTVGFGVPLWALAYTAGVGATALHVSLGTEAFLEAEGMLEPSRSARVVRAVVYGIGLSIFVLGFDAVALLSTGTHFWLAAP